VTGDIGRPESISNEHTISKSLISNVTFGIEGPTLDIGVARIQMVPAAAVWPGSGGPARGHIWKPEKVYNNGIYLEYTRHMTTYSTYLSITWHIPVI
jgi:hypothetical protein